MIYDLILSFNLCILSLFVMMMIYKFMLVLLMIMEFLILSISLVFYSLFSMMGMEIYVIYYLIFSVCESVLGLMLLVLVIRFQGEELYYSMNLFKYYVKMFICVIINNINVKKK